MKTHIKVLFISLFILCINFANAQYIEDALRFAQPINGLGARALGMGNAYTSIADDYTAVWWNPAGLGQVKRNEFSFGLSSFSYNNEANYLGNSKKTDENNLPLNNLGFVYAFPTMRGSLVVGFGYNKTNNFTTGFQGSGYNAYSSINSSKIPGSRPANTKSTAYEDWLLTNIPFQLYLTDGLGQFTPIKNNVQQDVMVTETGNLGNWAFSGAMEVSPNFMVGASLLINSGSYIYDRKFTETDVNNKHNIYDTVNYSDLDFYRAVYYDHINGNYSGVGAIIGIHYNYEDMLRFGLTIKTPFSYSVKEDYYTSGTSEFDNGDYFGPWKVDGKTEYTVTTPPVISAGVSYSFMDFLAAVDFDWIDYAKLEFSDADEDLLRELNTDIKNTFRSVFNLKFGLEYKLPFDNVKIRAGYAMYPSPYDGDPSDYDRKVISFGLSYLLAESILIDGTYAIGNYKTINSMYDSVTRTDEKISTNTLMLNLGIRF
jgi:long-subunit fatty acid transport protein